MSNLNVGTFYLITNNNAIDQYLLNVPYLLSRIKQIKQDNITNNETIIATKRNDLATLQQAMIDNSADETLVPQIQQAINNLNTQIDILVKQTPDPTIDDIKVSHDVFISNIFKPAISVGYWYSQTGSNNAPLFGGLCKIAVPVYGNFFTDMILNIKISEFSAIHPSNKVQYCAFPGHRLIQKISFIMNDIVMDSYGSEEINFHYDFEIPDSQKKGWKRCVGQELPKRCFLTQDPLNQEVREEKLIYDGYQTLKHTQPILDIFLPLDFWFCNPKYAMNNFNVVYGKTFIEIVFAPVTDMIACADYMNDGGQMVLPTITQCNLFTNHIFVTPEVAEVLTSASTMSLIRIHKNMQRTINLKQDRVLINELKFAIEDMKIIFRPAVNSTNDNAMETWNKNSVINYTELSYPSIMVQNGVKSYGYTNGYYYTENNVIDSIGIISGETILYDNISPTFYDSYMPYRYGKTSILTPSHSGSYLVTFNLFPNKEQPSGYFNISNARETYLKYTSSYISSNNVVNLYISAKTINFIALEQGSAVIKFIT